MYIILKINSVRLFVLHISLLSVMFCHKPELSAELIQRFSSHGLNAFQTSSCVLLIVTHVYHNQF